MRKQGIFTVFSLLLACFLFTTSVDTRAQYFGRNKPGYRNFNYKVYQTPVFEIYHYFKNDSVIRYWALQSEKWYRRHSRVFRDTFDKPNPLILYSNHADFQQTTAVSGMIGVGTGGVTESMKNRVVLPLAASTAQTDHVLGHELVHAFQFHLLTSDDSSSMSNVNSMPLWMIEGMAEYLSIGSLDSHTAMWMRDALLQDDFPTLKDLTTSAKYFPYRYGHAFWAMVGKIWGDDKIVPLFIETAKFGYEQAIESILGVNTATFSSMWKSSYKVHYEKYLKDSVDQLSGKKLLDLSNAGKYNISPAVSPDGKYIAFYSERDLVTIDLFLADANTGKILRKLSSRVHTTEIDDFNFLESAGAWSPDGKQLAYVVFSKGMNKLIIQEVESSRVIREIAIPGIPAFNNPAWSPDGRTIVVAGMQEGVIDLFSYDLNSGQVKNLTNDNFSEVQPSYSRDGNYIIYATDMTPEQVPGTLQEGGYNLAILDLSTGSIRVLDVFRGAENLNPVFSPDNRSVYFLSNSDGFRNLFRYDLDTDKTHRLTDYMTGISGITTMSPAVSLARDIDRITYSYYWKNEYRIYSATSADFQAVEVNPDSLNFEAATLPPWKRVGTDLVDNNFVTMTAVDDTLSHTFKQLPFRPKFRLDYISNVNMGVATTSRYGTGMAGSIVMLFSDIIGDNQIYSQLALNGEIYDFGGQVAYLNQKRKLNWGASLSHIPYLNGYFGVERDTLSIDDQDVLVDNYYIDYMRMFEDQVSLFSYLPFSQTRRMEVGTSLSTYYYRIDQFNNYYDSFTGIYIGSNREKLDAPKGFTLHKMDIAYVEDNSYSGYTSPIRGHRARVSFEKYNGSINMYTALVDYRKYFYIRPLTLAIRTYHYGRYGSDSENSIMYPLYLGYPWLIRGYRVSSFSSEMLASEQITVNQLVGSRIAVGNIELRIPFSGPERYGLFRFKYIPSELSLFMDTGVAWDSQNSPVFRWLPEETDDRVPVMTIGASLRLNILGYVILEPFYAMPVQGKIMKGAFGLNFYPGW